MKQQILDLIRNVKGTFANRTKNMPRTHVHKPFIAEMTDDQTHLVEADTIITQLDDTKPNFVESALFYFMEHVMPVCRRWLSRIKEMSKETEVSGHILASTEFETMRGEIYLLVEQMNGLTTHPIAFEAQTEPAGKSIIRSYNRETYLSTHTIQEIENPVATHQPKKFNTDIN